jgi:hypothetical protein
VEKGKKSTVVRVTSAWQQVVNSRLSQVDEQQSARKNPTPIEKEKYEGELVPPVFNSNNINCTYKVKMPFFNYKNI